MKSAFTQLDRAKFHRDNLSTEVAAYRARDPYDWVMRRFDHVTDKSLTVVEVAIDLGRDADDSRCVRGSTGLSAPRNDGRTAPPKRRKVPLSVGGQHLTQVVSGEGVNTYSQAIGDERARLPGVEIGGADVVGERA